MKTLSILIPTLPQRMDSLCSLLADIEVQIGRLPLLQQDKVEVLWLGDYKGTNTVGSKRNKLAQISKGDYITFVDDDDTLSPNYISSLLKAINSVDSPDVVCFTVQISINGAEPKPVYYSKWFNKDQNLKDRYIRIPNHLMCFKRHLVTQTPYENINFREDAIWAKKVLPKIGTEIVLNEVLYYYNANSATSETLPLHIKAALNG